MKKIIVIAAIMLGSQLFAQEVPEVIQDLDYDRTEIPTEDGEMFEVFIVEDDYNTLKKRMRKMKVVEVDREGTLLFVVREDDVFEYVSSRGFGFKRVTIYTK
tara:strand:+ start:2971 stop:3276 length:306 start_codon:yes stop_codon:yes gene_type:complete